MSSTSTTPAPDPGGPLPEHFEFAALWLARRDAGLSPAETAEFYRWLNADRRHAGAFRELEASWFAFDTPRQHGQAERMIRELARRRRRRRWQVAAGSAAAATVALAAAWAFVAGPAPRTDGPATAANARVEVLKPEVRRLSDGSVIELNAGAEIATDFSNSRRRIRLLRGEALFTVAKDSTRPFVVVTLSAELQAIGTQFSVQLRPAATQVLVTEGSVTVGKANQSAAAPVAVSAGSQLLVPAGGAPAEELRVQRVSPAEIERHLAWRAPRLELSNTPLPAVAAAMNRENKVQLVIADRSLRHLRLSGVFRADQAEDFVRLLEIHYGVRIERRGRDQILLRNE